MNHVVGDEDNRKATLSGLEHNPQHVGSFLHPKCGRGFVQYENTRTEVDRASDR